MMSELFLFCLFFILPCIHGDRGAVSTMRGMSHGLLGGERCTWGPSYWCNKVQNAKECAAVSHCTQSVWLKNAEPQDPSRVCRWCDDLMDDIRAAINGNMSKAVLRGSLKDACKRIPDVDKRANCVQSLSADLPEVIQLLQAGVPDRTVCRTISFCVADRDSSSMKLKSTPRDRDICEDCKNFFEDAKELYLGNYTADEFKAMLLQQCEQAGYPALIDLCKTAIQQYWDQIYARLQMFFDPDQMCNQINFCNSTTNTSPRRVIPLTKLVPASMKSYSQPAQLPLERMLLNILPASAVPSPISSMKAQKPYKNDVECVVCEFVMSYLDKMLEDNYTEASIQSALDRVCGVMPKSVRSDCQSFVDQYAPAILVILGNELDPAQVCNGLQLCQSRKKYSVCGGGGATCAACTEVFQAIKTLLEDYDENVRLAQLLQNYCNQLPAEAKEQCVNAVITYVPYVLQMIGQLMKPDGVCRVAKMC